MTRRPSQDMLHGMCRRARRHWALAICLWAGSGCGDNRSIRPLDDAGNVPGCCDGIMGGGTGGTIFATGGRGGADGQGGQGGEGGHGGSAAVDGGAGGLAAKCFTVIALPDTQYYSSTYPQIFDAQMQWIVDQRANQNIAFVLHEGDIVNADVTPQWENASRAMHKLDGLVPYVVSQGNHDYFVQGGIDDRSTMINQYFSVADLAKNPGFLGSFEADHVENTAQFLMMGDTAWLVISLEFGPRDVVLTWADRMLKAHPDVPAMVVTHAYLYYDGNRYDHINYPRQQYSPYAYSLAPAPGSVNDGEEIWRKLIRENANIQFVISGHTIKPDEPLYGEAAATLTSTHPGGEKVHQVVANYQQTAMGGSGYLRLMRFCPDAGQVRVSTYSPYLDRWKRDAANEFTLALP